MNANEHAKSKAQRGCKQKMPTDTVVGESERKKDAFEITKYQIKIKYHAKYERKKNRTKSKADTLVYIKPFIHDPFYVCTTVSFYLMRAGAISLYLSCPLSISLCYRNVYGNPFILFHNPFTVLLMLAAALPTSSWAGGKTPGADILDVCCVIYFSFVSLKATEIKAFCIY